MKERSITLQESIYRFLIKKTVQNSLFRDNYLDMIFTASNIWKSIWTLFSVANLFSVLFFPSFPSSSSFWVITLLTIFLVSAFSWSCLLNKVSPKNRRTGSLLPWSLSIGRKNRPMYWKTMKNFFLNWMLICR